MIEDKEREAWETLQHDLATQIQRLQRMPKAGLEEIASDPSSTFAREIAAEILLLRFNPNPAIAEEAHRLMAGLRTEQPAWPAEEQR